MIPAPRRWVMVGCLQGRREEDAPRTVNKPLTLRPETQESSRLWIKSGQSADFGGRICPGWRSSFPRRISGPFRHRNRIRVARAADSDRVAGRLHGVGVFSPCLERMEATPGIEPGFTDLQSAASPLRHVASTKMPGNARQAAGGYNRKPPLSTTRAVSHPMTKALSLLPSRSRK